MYYLPLFNRAMLGFVMVLAATGKVVNRAAWLDFVGSLSGLRWPAPRWRSMTAVAVVLTEATAAVLMLPAATAPFGMLLCAGTLAAFTAATMASRAAGVEVRCRCFGVDDGPIGQTHWLRNAALVIIALIGAGFAFRGSAGSHSPLVEGLVVAAGAFAALVFAYWHDLIFLFGPAARRG